MVIEIRMVVGLTGVVIFLDFGNDDDFYIYTSNSIINIHI